MPPKALSIGVTRPQGRGRSADANTVDLSVTFAHEDPVSVVALEKFDADHSLGRQARSVAS